MCSSSGNFVSANAAQNESAEVQQELESKLDDIDKAIEMNLLKLARFNIAYNYATTLDLSRRTLGYAFGRQAGTAVSFSGAMVDLSERARAINDVDKLSKSARRHATICSFTGNSISASASALELAQNLWSTAKARKKGFAIGKATQFVLDIVKNTDELFAKRRSLVASEGDPKQKKADELEQKLLSRIRQQLLFEFRKWSGSSRDLAWRENCFFTLDIMQNMIGCGSNLLALRSFHDPSRAGSASIWLLVQSASATANPPLSILLGYMVRKHNRHKLEKTFPCQRPDFESVLSDEERKELQASRRGRMYEEAIFLSKSSELMDNNLDVEVAQIDRLREVAQQQAIAGPLIGLTGLARGVLATVAYYRFRDDREIANKLLFAGRVSQVTGQAYALWDTPYTMYKGIRRNRKLREKGQLPSQILEERLKRLETIESHINTAH